MNKSIKGSSTTGPSFCWWCGKQLMRAGKGLVHYHLIKHKDQGTEHRVHGYPCRDFALAAGHQAVR